MLSCSLAHEVFLYTDQSGQGSLHQEAVEAHSLREGLLHTAIHADPQRGHGEWLSLVHLHYDYSFHRTSVHLLLFLSEFSEYSPVQIVWYCLLSSSVLPV